MPPQRLDDLESAAKLLVLACRRTVPGRVAGPCVELAWRRGCGDALGASSARPLRSPASWTRPGCGCAHPARFAPTASQRCRAAPDRSFMYYFPTLQPEETRSMISMSDKPRATRPCRSFAMTGAWLGTVTLVLIATLALALPSRADVNVYSARKEHLIKPLLDRFTASTGVPVNLVTADAGPLLERLRSEGRNSPADILITVDAGNLHAAKEAGVLQPVSSPALTAAIPAAYRDPQGHWFGLSLRARPIMYVKGKVPPGELSSYEDLADPRWKGRICIRSSNNIYNQSMVAAILAVRGEAATLAWLQGFVGNFARKPSGGDRDQIKAATAGECDIAIANTYYLAQMITSKDASERDAAARIAVFWPNQDGRGAHVNVSGAGVTAAAKNKDDAIRLLEFLVTDASQQWYANVNNEYPVHPGITLSETVAGFGKFKADDLNLSRLGLNNRPAVQLMDRAGWK